MLLRLTVRGKARLPSLTRRPRSRSRLSAMSSATFQTTEGVDNPLLSNWTDKYGLPPFASIKAQHFAPALKVGMAHHLFELGAIASSADAPSFDNTIAALDRAGGVLGRANLVFSNLCSSCSSPELQGVELEIAPLLAAHETKVSSFPGLFARVAAVRDGGQEGLTSEQQRLCERVYLDLVRSGAKMSPEAQARYGQIMEELSVLLTTFSQNVMKDESEVTLDVSDADLAGCPDFIKESALAAAAEKGKPAGSLTITLSRSIVEPFLTFSPRRDLREKVWRMWTNRGQLAEDRNNLSIAKQILLLRSEQASLHGYATFADYQLADTMAQTPSRVTELLERVWGPATASANRERDVLHDFLAKDLKAPRESVTVEPWDWRYCAEAVRKVNFDFDEAQLKPFLSLPAMQAALFDVCHKLYGLRFVRVHDVVAHHPDAEVYEVRETVDGADKLVAVFLHDNFLRSFKQSGAWMSVLQEQSRNSNAYSYEVADGKLSINSTASTSHVTPIVLNTNNFAKGSPCLLSFDDCITLFHECGHGLHGMLTDRTYKTLSGTNVLRDFVELPSQLLEHWLRSTNVVFQEHAKHFTTGETISADVLAKLTASRNFNQGFATVEYSICAMLDQGLHALPKSELEALDIQLFEETELRRLGMPQGICMRHRPAHFLHLFSSSSYASAYYVYLWAEVLDADAWGAFVEAGDVFDATVAKMLRANIYSTGNSVDPAAAFRAFRGRDPDVQPMLRKKGLTAAV